MRRLCLALALILGAPASAEEPAATQGEIRLVADPFPTAEVALKRGTLPVRVSLGFDRALLLNLAPAKATGLKPFPIIGKFRVRNPQIPGGEAVIRGNLITADVGNTGRQSLPTVWIDKDVVPPPHAGVVSVMAFRAERVHIRNPSAPAGGATYRLVRAGRGDSEVKWRLGRDTVNLVFDFTSEATILNARAAAILEREGLVRRTGRVGLWSPVPALQLPVELLNPVAGANAFGLPLKRPAARISPARARELDARAAEGIVGAAEDDPDAIVVTAERERTRGRAPWMLIGRDVLQYCSEVRLDRPDKSWILSCAFPG
jgi:hypothetical protein